MTPYRQPIRPGDTGSDVLAVKRALRKIGVKGAGAMTLSKRAGPAFVACLATLQRQHHLPSDGLYGPKTHAILAPQFDAYGALLYRTATIRRPPPPPLPATAVAAAKTLLDLYAHGRYTADNPGDLRDIQAAAAGKPVWSQGGYWVHIDPRPLQVLCWLIQDKGFELGTYAICSDHHDDGPHGHAGGFAVDIVRIDGIAIGSSSAKSATLAVATALHQTPTILKPRQLICGGYGNHPDGEIAALTVPSASFYGLATMLQHCNHIHVGY